VSIYLYAFCLDEGKAKKDHESLYVGPLDWAQITWDFLRASDENETIDDMQFIRHESGFWYPVVIVGNGPHGGGTMEADLSRGRYSDISIITELDSDDATKLVPTACRTIAHDDVKEHAMFKALSTVELAWLDEPYDD
jgi:hypothetical protein